MLYPLKFKPIYKQVIWGGTKLNNFASKKGNVPENCGESWEISTIESNVSIVENGFLKGNSLLEILEIYMGDLVGEWVYSYFGNEFPLLIKFIDANDDLSVQVHPNDEQALSKHNSYGKTEMWYIINAEENAELISGFSKNTNSNEVNELINSGDLKTILNYEKVNEDDVFFIPAGRVHAIGKGIVLAEIQQSSNITYRLYDWNRKDINGNKRELHVNDALEVLDFNATINAKTEYKSATNLPVNIAKCEYFSVNIIQFSGSSVARDLTLLDTFIILMGIKGTCIIEMDNTYKEKLNEGESILIPACAENIVFIPDKNCKILEIFLELPNYDN